MVDTLECTMAPHGHRLRSDVAASCRTPRQGHLLRAQRCLVRSEEQKGVRSTRQARPAGRRRLDALVARIDCSSAAAMTSDRAEAAQHITGALSSSSSTCSSGRQSPQARTRGAGSAPVAPDSAHERQRAWMVPTSGCVGKVVAAVTRVYN